MTVVSTIERAYTPPSELGRTPSSATSVITGQTLPIWGVTATLSLTSTTIYCASIMLGKNQPVSNLGAIVTTAGTVTGFFLALLDAGLTVRAVTANQTSLSTGYQNFAVTTYLAAYAGLYYVAVGTVSSAAAVLGAGAAAASAATNAGPPVYAGTSSTAATTTPPAVGTTLGALTGTTTALFYGQTS